MFLSVNFILLVLDFQRPSRDFKIEKSYRTLGSGVTQFIAKFEKMCLSAIIDLYTIEVLAFEMSRHLKNTQIRRTMVFRGGNYCGHHRD